MKKILNILMMGLIAAVCLGSCDNPVYPTEENPTTNNKNGEGKLSSVEFKLNIVNSEIVVESRSGADINAFTVNIIDTNTSKVSKSWLYGEMPEIVTLPVGDYRIDVYNTELANAAWDAPYYKGSKEFSITKDEITEIGEVKCVLSNVKVSIKYTDALKAAIGAGNDVKVNVVVGTDNSIDFTYGETRSAYFKYDATSTTLVATFSGTIDGYYMSDFKVFTDIEAGQHRIITFGLKDTPVPPDEYGAIGTSGLGLSSKVTVVDMTINVPVTEEPIEPDDMLQLSANSLSMAADASSKTLTVKSTSAWTVESDQAWCTVSAASGVKGESSITVRASENSAETARTAKLTFKMGVVSVEVTVKQAAKGDDSMPTITSKSLDLEGVNEITSGMVAQVTINVPKTIKNLMVKIDSPTLTPDDLDEVGLASEFDLANPATEDLGTNLKNLGFPTGDEVVGKTTLLFDISQFMGLLNTFKSEHKFIITVIDAENQSTQATLTFIAR